MKSTNNKVDFTTDMTKDELVERLNDFHLDHILQIYQDRAVVIINGAIDEVCGNERDALAFLDSYITKRMEQEDQNGS